MNWDCLIAFILGLIIGAATGRAEPTHTPRSNHPRTGIRATDRLT